MVPTVSPPPVDASHCGAAGHSAGATARGSSSSAHPIFGACAGRFGDWPADHSQPLDAEHGERHTRRLGFARKNERGIIRLALTQVASIFELRSGLEMPETVAEVYKVATQAMLARTGAGPADLTPLLQAVFFEAHTRQQRIITHKHIEVAANKLRRIGMMNSLLELVKRDRMPLLTLLQVEPLELQAAHLSFQVRQIAGQPENCSDTVLTNHSCVSCHVGVLCCTSRLRWGND